MIYEDTRIYTALFKAADEFVIEKAQHFNPFFSWIAVTFTYFTIGIRGGDVWKYLFICSTAGFLATSLSVSNTLSKKLGIQNNVYNNIKYLEGYLWTLTEWGYTYINFIKIRSCVKSLRTRRWNIIMFIILIYSLVIRTILSYLDSNVDIFNKEDYERKKDRYHGLIFFPLGVISLIFIVYIIKDFLEETDRKNKSIIHSLLHSTLTRMLFVSLIFIGLSIVVHVPRQHYFWYFIRMVLWRLKGNLGIIFLVDMLLLRIDLDHKQLVIQNEKIEQLTDKSYSNEKHHLTNEEINKLNFNDLNINNSMRPLTSQNNEVEDFEPNDLIQENVSTHSQSHHSQRQSKNIFKQSLSASQHSVREGKDNGLSRLSFNKYNDLLYSQQSQHSQHSLHNHYNGSSQYRYSGYSNSAPVSSSILQTTLNSPTYSTYSNPRILTSPTSANMPYVTTTIQKPSPSSRVSASDLIINNTINNINKNKSSPSTNSTNNSDITYKPTSNEDLLYTRITKAAKTHPGNIVLESTLQ